MLKKIIVAGLLFTSVNAQEKIPNPIAIGSFGYPLEGNYRFSGNYGEIRPNHFHSGIDFRTDPVKNLPIHVIDDGYVSRIKIGTNGYGKVLYITHKNGYVSVYGHEHHFAKKIQDFTYAEQKKKETFEIEIFPKPEDLPVKKGEVIGYTGNTGNTTGPHLHFEIRDEKTEVPLNPQLYLEHKDDVAPVCYKMAVYRIHASGEPYLAKTIDLSGLNKKKDMELKETVIFPPRAGLAFSCFDKESASGGNNQVYEIKIYVDTRLIYHHKMNNIPFDHARYVNWYADQHQNVKKEKFQKCFRTGTNELAIYTQIANNGLIDISDFSPGEIHIALVTFADIKGNKSALSFNFKTREENGYEDKTYNFNCLKKNEFHLKGMDVTIPEKTLFCDVNFDCKIFKTSSANCLGPVYKIHSSNVNVLKGFDVQIAPTAFPKGKEDKLCLLHFEDDMTEMTYCGGEFKDGKVTGTLKNLGLIAVGIDTVAPKLNRTGVSKKAGNNLSAAKGIFFNVSDNLSGLGNFRMEINGKWVLAEYEHKTNTIFYLFTD
ncbi:MAG: M23 family metallopeptidase, partial [Bacteroidia bacterium]|nr:M23 family metallopeptidase [Bacteroidia bacterium]